MIDKFLQLETAGGILLMLAAVCGLILANSPFAPQYDLLISTPVEIRVGGLEIAKPLLLWINDGLMATFFFLVGLELKRELLEGELSQKESIILPAAGAVGGIAIPGLVYTWFNYQDPIAMQGWAIPTATDIAFALGIIGMLGSRIPVTVKIFLTSIAIFDDIAAIIIIALFYTAEISVQSLLFVLACLPVLYLLNRNGTESKFPFLLIGVFMWIAMLKSGIHATLTGVILAFFIPLKPRSDSTHSMLKSLEHDLHGTVAFFVLPAFAFANAGIALSGVGIDVLLHSVPMGIAAGLFIGKQVGIFACCWLVLRMGLTRMPIGMNMLSLYGVAVLCGVGFTMSLFIGSLAFEATGTNMLFDERVGIIVGSVISGIFGFIILHICYKNPAKNEET